MVMNFFTGSSDECAAELLSTISSLTTQTSEIKTQNIFYTPMDCPDFIANEFGTIRAGGAYSLPEIYRVFYSMNAMERYDVIKQSIVDLNEWGYLPADYKIPISIMCLFGLEAPTKANPSGYSAQLAMTNLAALCNQFQESASVPVAGVMKHLIADIHSLGVDYGSSDFDINDTTGTNVEFFQRYTFLLFLYLHRSVFYVVDRTFDGAEDFKDNCCFVTMNEALLKGLQEKGLLLNGTGDLLTSDGFDKFIASLKPKTPTLLKHFKENQYDCAKLLLHRNEAGVMRFKVTKALLPLGYYTLDEYKATEKNGKYHTYKYFSVASIYEFLNAMKQATSAKYYKVTKETSFGDKEAIITLDAAVMRACYADADDSMAKDDFMSMLDQIDIRFNPYSLRYEFFNVESSLSSKGIFTVKPHAIKTLSVADESLINKSLHILNNSVLKDYVVACLNKLTKAKIEYPETANDGSISLTTLLPIAEGTTVREYINNLKTFLTGWSPNGENRDIESAMSLKDLWSVVSNPGFKYVFGDVQAESFTFAELPAWKRNFTPVPLPDSSTIESKAVYINSVIEQYMHTHALKIKYRKTDGTLSQGILSKSYTALKKVYRYNNWLSIVPLVSRLNFAKSLTKAKYTTSELVFILGSSVLDISNDIEAFAKKQSKKLTDLLKEFIAEQHPDFNSPSGNKVLTQLDLWWTCHSFVNSLGLYADTDLLTAIVDIDSYDTDHLSPEDKEIISDKLSSYSIVSFADARFAVSFNFVINSMLDAIAEQDARVEAQRVESKDLAVHNITLFALENYKGHSTQTIKPTNVVEIAVSPIESNPATLTDLIQSVIDRKLEVRKQKLAKKNAG